ncbi:MAG: type II secretion system protein GspM [Gammaproteobacteria bacterium]
MNQWWESLEKRERLMVGGLGIFMVVFFFYMFLLEPLYANAADYKEKTDRAERDLAYLQQAVVELQTSNSGAGRRQRNVVDPNASLNVIVDRTRTAYSLAATNTQQVGPQKLRVRLEDARFDDVVKWLGDLRSQYGIAIETASVNQTGVRGTTTASLTLSRENP